MMKIGGTRARLDPYFSGLLWSSLVGDLVLWSRLPSLRSFPIEVNLRPYTSSSLYLLIALIYNVLPLDSTELHIC
jgi:hypothetical protein